MRCFSILAAVGILLALGATAGAGTYVPSSDLVLGAYDAARGYQIVGPQFQLNLVYQSGIDDDDIDAFNAYPPGPLNTPDGDMYYLKADPAGLLLIGIYDYISSPAEQEYAPDSGQSWVQWTLSYWDGEFFQTIFAGDIVEDPFLRVVPTAGYRSFLGDGLANPVEIFSGATVQSEVLGYSYTGTLGEGSVLDVKIVPEPVTMISGFLAIGGLGAFIRRHMRAPAAA